MRRTLSSLFVAVAVLSPIALVASPANAAKAGQLCKAADEGKTQDGVKCTKDGTRFRWVAGAATTKAPTTKKSTATTKKPTATTKKPTETTKKPTATTNKPTETTKKSTGTTKQPTASTGGGDPVNGRFCATVDKGRRATDAKGRKLTCKADANGKNRWQL